MVGLWVWLTPLIFSLKMRQDGQKKWLGSEPTLVVVDFFCLPQPYFMPLGEASYATNRGLLTKMAFAQSS